ncbi:MAG: glutamine-hydrolyzing GMP synthase, partial [Bacteroidales bacterium]
MQETILILDFGSQYTQLIARRVRELNVYCEIHPFNLFPAINKKNIKGVILSGSPYSVLDVNSPSPDLEDIKGKLPLLAVCYGAQFLAHNFGGEVMPSKIREYGRANLSDIDTSDPLMKNMTKNCQVWMSHGDTIAKEPAGAKIIAATKNVRVAGFQIKNEETYGIQFHPEVYHSTEGMILLKNFVVDICNCAQSWTP